MIYKWYNGATKSEESLVCLRERRWESEKYIPEIAWRIQGGARKEEVTQYAARLLKKQEMQEPKADLTLQAHNAVLRLCHASVTDNKVSDTRT